MYLSLHCHHQNDSCIKMGSDESHFNVSVGSDGRSHKTVSTNHNLFEEKGEPKWYRTEVLPLTNLTRLTPGPNRLTRSSKRDNYFNGHRYARQSIQRNSCGFETVWKGLVQGRVQQVTDLCQLRHRRHLTFASGTSVRSCQFVFPRSVSGAND